MGVRKEDDTVRSTSSHTRITLAPELREGAEARVRRDGEMVALDKAEMRMPWGTAERRSMVSFCFVSMVICRTY